jgi:CRISPR-associated protein Cas2
MMVIVLEDAPARLRGGLSLWMVEVRAGVYVGHCSKRHRERLWARVCRTIDADARGNAVLAWTARNEAGYSFETHGKNRREPVDLDGLRLISFQPIVDEEALAEERAEAEMRDWIAEMYYNEKGEDIYFEEDDDLDDFT